MAAQSELSDGERTVLQRAMEIVASITSPGGAGNGAHSASCSQGSGLGGAGPSSVRAVEMGATPRLGSRPGASKQPVLRIHCQCYCASSMQGSQVHAALLYPPCGT